MKDAILNFGKQFDFIPEIRNKENIKNFRHIILLGMGGSHLAADVAKNINPSLDIYIHSDYGLPDFSEEFLRESIIIASSYSGNTEEVLDGISKAISLGLNCAALSVGGKLLQTAKENNLPYVEIPDTGIQPRSALGFSLASLAFLLNDSEIISQIELIRGKIKPEEIEKEGKKLAENIVGFVPIIYSSTKNFSLAYNWKIKFNETGKIPAFYNVFPELNHNEMTGFDAIEKSKNLSEKFKIIFLIDEEDNEQIKKRMKVCEELYLDKGLKTISFKLLGRNKVEKIFNSLLLADWTAYYIALNNNADPEKVPMIEEFKKLIS